MNRTNISAPKLVMILSAANTNISLYGTVNINSDGSNAVLCRSVAFSQANASAVGKIDVTGNVMICGTIKEGRSNNYSCTRITG